MKKKAEEKANEEENPTEKYLKTIEKNTTFSLPILQKLQKEGEIKNIIMDKETN